MIKGTARNPLVTIEAIQAWCEFMKTVETTDGSWNPYAGVLSDAECSSTVFARQDRNSYQPFLNNLLAVFCLLFFWAVADAQDLGGVTVTTDQAPIQKGEKVITRAKKGEELTVCDVKGDWYCVMPSRGWISGKFVQFHDRDTETHKRGEQRKRPTTKNPLSPFTVTTGAAVQATLTIEKATTTTQPQAIIQSIIMNRFVAEPIKAKAGQIFLVITFSLEVKEKEFEVEWSKELLWSHPQQENTVCGYGKMFGSNQWNAGYSSVTLPKGKHAFDLLYLVPTNQINGAAIKFLGKDYPIKVQSGK